MTRRDGVAAFAGWGDAGESATSAVRALLDAYPVEHLGTIDCERHIDFQVNRPQVAFDDSGRRELSWPDTELWLVQAGSGEIVVVTGHEPNFAWRSFTQEILGHFQSMGVDRLVTLGAFAGEVAHTAPVPLIGSGASAASIEEWGLEVSNYEGPTGITGVVTSLAAETGISVLSIWAAVPHYLSGQDYPPGTLALIEKLNSILGTDIATGEFFEAAAIYRRDVDAAVSRSEIREYVQGLEAESLTGDSDTDPALQLVEEIERYLGEG